MPSQPAMEAPSSSSSNNNASNSTVEGLIAAADPASTAAAAAALAHTFTAGVPFASGAQQQQEQGPVQQHDAATTGRRGQGYRKLWQKVSQVNPGDSAVIVSDCTVEDMLRTIKSLGPRDSAVAAVRCGIGYLDSRALAFLFKELGKCKLTHRAIEIFDWLQTQTDPELANLCDVFTYTTIISLCGSPRLLWKALRLVGSMRSKGIACNTHTCSALMSVCVKAKQAGLALDVYNEMRRDGLKPSVVTYNTLIDAYGKLGIWTDAVGVLDAMEGQGIKPEARTYNSVVRACSESMQPDEAYNVYARMLKVGEKPTAATFTPTINAYCEQGRVLEAITVFNDMVASGCERTPATYATLLDACEKAGQAQLMLQLIERMQQDGFTPEMVRAARTAAQNSLDKPERGGATGRRGYMPGGGHGSHFGGARQYGHTGGRMMQQQQHPPPYGLAAAAAASAGQLQLPSSHVANNLGMTMSSMAGLGLAQSGVQQGNSAAQAPGYGTFNLDAPGMALPRIPPPPTLPAPAQGLQGAGWDDQPNIADLNGERLIFFNGQLMQLQ